MATGIPDSDQTPAGPAYEGRLLDRPEEEVVDQGVRFDMRTLLGRRALIGAGLLGVGAVVLTACTGGGGSGSSAGSAGTSSAAGEIPDETAGPYPGDGSNGPDVLDETGIVRRDIRSSIGADDPVDGIPLEFTLRISDMQHGDAAFAGVAVYAWHCDAQGRYSLYSEGVEDESWLRGVQVADSAGEVTFISVMPGCYTGRWTHIHFEVYPDVDAITDASNAIATSQLAIPEDVLADVYAQNAYAGSAENLARITLASDNVFGDDGAELQLATVSGDTANGYRAELDVRIDTATTPTAGAAPAGDPDSGGGSGSGGGPGSDAGGAAGGPGGEPPSGAPGTGGA
ncbi:3,4-dioxygenase subunit beta [Leucobacter allii]|uniref:3,4-dioxygenase subunit beta n=1 Tax=Leucobacter allii TaxID=2932247 RepID=A0ABY4FL23_9MICO|nr:3,4-dioxygenase subunit beta [Leucobacter allii]UOQ56961.1 3,4-dioxygenase subunit beta [Leucobacter allii]